ncbi:SAM-dependent methyltransferase [Cellulomonas edaphi]|uniref:Class I SAM-dependent methyltransferase n=1 Tax=Cellulomonas edaphi TaxID=3053468 RepID=A0ABT7S9Q4_9CELL|nr:class I SAM-dependent methyltransferase [Cellulomons edaphi]MDM7832331.1 class I SAM-dependent methyltransferase [Cellulomons edaphi]
MTGDMTASAQYWEERYRDRDPAWGTQPNATLVAVLSGLDLAPGAALDLGCGHGGDALWLARGGWRVTAVDVSAIALGRVADAAHGLAVTTERHDVTQTLPRGEFDLVTATYFQTPLDIDRDAIVRRVSDRVRPGGTLVVIDHGSVPPSSGLAHVHEFPTPDETLASIGLGACWTPLRTDTAVRELVMPEGDVVELLDNVLVLRRAG